MRSAALALVVAALVGAAVVGVAGRARAGTLVRFTTSLGSFDVELYDSQTPLTVANFLAHVAAGNFTNTLVHRSARSPIDPLAVGNGSFHPERPFVIQAGSYRFDGTPRVQPGEYPEVTQCPGAPVVCPVPNEPFLPTPRNVRGTLAMAKTSDPNSATSGWFINLHDDNAGILDPSVNAGGFTVFGRVLRDGMDVADAIGALFRCNFGGAWAEPPLRNFVVQDCIDSDLPVGGDNLVVVSSVSVMADSDGDLVTDAEDNCPTTANADQVNFDADAAGDACDSCPTVANAGSDPDMDGVDQACDTCQLQANPVFTGGQSNRTRVSGQLDDDADGRGNACDFDYDNAGAVVTSTDFNLAKAAIGKLVSQSTCAGPVGGRCGAFDHDAAGGVVSASDFNAVKAAIGKTIAASYPTCSTCSVGTGWSDALGSAGARVGRPICQSAVTGACVYAP